MKSFSIPKVKLVLKLTDLVRTKIHRSLLFYHTSLNYDFLNPPFYFPHELPIVGWQPTTHPCTSLLISTSALSTVYSRGKEHERKTRVFETNQSKAKKYLRNLRQKKHLSPLFLEPIFLTRIDRESGVLFEEKSKRKGFLNLSSRSGE